jgi:8-oxo-dGTP pyrophosphatase MutT (NUDIX family)
MPHIHEKIDFTVEVFIVHNNKVLLRKHDKYGIWLSIGGHIELDEDPNQAALREVREEVGIEAKLADDLLIFTEPSPTYVELIPPKFLNRHTIKEGHEHVCLSYFATCDSPEFTNQESEKSDAIRWFSAAELESPEVTPGVRAYAKRALAELSSPMSRE